jgi:hypothetical protein
MQNTWYMSDGLQGPTLIATSFISNVIIKRCGWVELLGRLRAMKCQSVGDDPARDVTGNAAGSAVWYMWAA